MRFTAVFRGLAACAVLCAASLGAWGQTVNSFTVVNADTGADIATLTTQGSVSIAGAPRINVRANATGAASVVFTDATAAKRTENTAPFAYKGDNNGVYNPWSPAAGIYTINAAPFAAAGGTGTAGPVATLRLTVTTGSASFSVSGVVSGAVVNGVSVHLGSTNSSATTTTNASGAYSFGAVPNGSYTITPTLSGFSFSPLSSAVTVNGANVSGRNFTSSASNTPTFSISGVVSGAAWSGVTVAVSGAATASTITDVGGNYTVAGLKNGSYTVTPGKTGFSFAPASKAVTLNGANVGGIDFTASAANPSGVALWHPTVLPFTHTGTYSNAYMQGAMTATFTGPNGETLKIPGYYTGTNKWAVRFSPTAVGAWTYVTQSADAGLNGKRGSINAIANTNPKLHGPLQVDAAHPTRLKYKDGTQYFQMGYEADWLALMDLGPNDVPAARAKALIDKTIAPNGFNEVLLQFYAYNTSWGKDPASDFGPTNGFPWGGTNAAPDHSHINPLFFDRLDAVIDHLFQKGINAHLMLMVFNKQVNWPTARSAEDNKWVQYITARYQAYPNMIWDFSKETFNVYDHADSAYIHERILIIKNNDAYQRMRTVHAPVNGGATPSGRNYWFDIKPNDLHFYSAEAVQGTNLYANTIQSMAKVGAFPYANHENSYQIGNDGTSTYSGAKQSVAKVHDDMMEVVMAGAGVGYYYAYHAWDNVRYNEIPAGIAFFKNLSHVFGELVTLGGLLPRDALIGGGAYGKHCLANPGKEYVVLLSPAANTTTVRINVTDLPSQGRLNATWHNLDTGASVAAAAVTANGTATYTKPFSGVGVLHLK